MPAKPSDDPNYKPAETWKDLEHIGSPEWVEQKLDRKPTFKGYGTPSVVQMGDTDQNVQADMAKG